MIQNQLQKIHHKAKEIATRYKRCEFELIEILEKVDRHKIHYKYGYSSLHKYATEFLDLSSEVAYIFINVSRKTREVPALKDEIKKGTITVSKAKKLSSVINRQNQGHWLNLAKTVSKQILEKHVAAVSPKQAINDKLAYVSRYKEISEKVKIMNILEAPEAAKKGVAKRHSEKARVQLQAGISEKLMLKIRRVQDLVSKKKRGPANLEETLEILVDLYIRKNDPIEKAKIQKMRGKLQDELVPGPVNGDSVSKQNMDLLFNDKSVQLSKARTQAPVRKTSLRQPIPAKTRHKLILKYRDQCSYIDGEGERCAQRRFLEIHHKQPVSKGGTNELSNLALLCSGHHKSHHLQVDY